MSESHSHSHAFTFEQEEHHARGYECRHEEALRHYARLFVIDENHERIDIKRP